MPRTLASIIKAANRAILIDGDLDAIGDFFAIDYRAHITGRDLARGHATVRQIVTQYRAAFTGMTVDVEILVTARDRIAWQRTLRARHTGSFKGFPATGRRIIWRDLVVSRFRKGRIAEDWVITDLAERLLRASRHR